MENNRATSVKIALRQIMARGFPRTSLGMHSINLSNREREALLKEDKDRLLELKADPLLMAELEVLKGNLKGSLSWIQKAKAKTNVLEDYTKVTNVWNAWLLYRLESKMDPQWPEWLKELEAGVTFVNRGQPMQGIALVQNSLPYAFQSGVVFWERALSAWAYALMHLGYFKEANRCASWQISLIKEGDLPTLRSTILRRMAVIAYFQRHLKSAIDSLDAVELLESRSRFNQLMAMNLRLTIALDQGQGFMAQRILDKIKWQRDQMQVRPEALQPLELECLWAYSRGQFREALPLAQNWLKESRQHEDRVGEVTAMIFLALLSSLQPLGGQQDLLGRLGSALDLARQTGLVSLLLSALLRASLAALCLKQVSQVELWMQEAVGLAKKRDAKEWLQLLTHFRDLMLPNVSSKGKLKAWLNLVSSSFGFYRERILVEKLTGFHVKGSPFSIESFFTFWPEDVVIYSRQFSFIFSLNKETNRRRMEFLDINKETQTGKIAATFLNGTSSVSLQEIHDQLSHLSFVPHRHEPHVRALVSQTRSLLDSLGIEIKWNREMASFQRRGPMIYEVEVDELGNTKAGRPQTRTQKARELGTYIKEMGFVTTSHLCEHFGYTRQGLYPIISLLVEQGIVRRVGLGNKSGVCVVAERNEPFL
jgi:hypothetical protein